MPKYQVELEDGQKFELETEGEMSQDELYNAAQHYALQQQPQQSQASTGEKVVGGIAQGVANIPGAIAGGIKSLGKAAMTTGQILSGSPQPWIGSDPMELLRGLHQGLSLGIRDYPAPPKGSEDLRNLGVTAGGVVPFAAGGGLLKALGMGAKTAAPLVAALMGGAKGAAEGDLEQAISGATTGAGSVGVAEAVGPMARGAAQRFARPYQRGVLEPQAQYEQQVLQERLAHSAKQAEIDTVNRAKILNHKLQLAQRSDVDAMNAQTLEQWKANIAYRDSLRAEIDKQLGVGGQPGELPGKLRFLGTPPASPKEAYAAFDIAAATPETLPVVQLKTSANVLTEVGQGIANSTEGLPRIAGPRNLTEKLAVGITEKLPLKGEQPIHPSLIQLYGKSIKQVPQEKLLSQSEMLYKQEALAQTAKGIGLEPDALQSLASGTLRLDQANRLLGLLGKASSNSRVAGKIFWSILDDLETAAKDQPLVRQLLDARASHRQQVAINDLSALATPSGGRITPNVGTIRAIFNSTKRTDKLLAESFSPEVRQRIVDVLDDVWQTKQEAAFAGKAVGPKPSFRPGTEPRYTLTEPLPPFKPSKLPPEPRFIRRKPEGAFAQGHWMVSPAIVTLLAHMAGMPVSWSGAMLGMAVATRLMPQIAFKLTMQAARTPQGAAFMKNLFSGERPSGANVQKLIALGQFVQAQERGEQQ